MATLKDIKGTNVQSVDADPSNPVAGQIWYNSTSRVLKAQRLSINGAFATAPALNTSREYVGAAGLQTAGLAFGGYTGTAYTGATEEYDGSSWTSSPASLNTARGNAATGGTQTAAILAGGNGNQQQTEDWNGTTWTNGTSRSNSIYYSFGS